MRERQQNSTSYPITFLLTSSTDHVTPVTGASPTVTLSKNGGAFAAAAGAVTEIANGWYALAGNATDRATLGGLIVHATATGADPFDGQFTIVPWDPFDARLGIAAIPATGVIPTVGTGTNQIALTAGAVTAGTVSDKTGYTVSTVQDKTGYSLTVTPPTASTIAAAVWNEPQSSHTTAGTFGLYLDAAVSGISGVGSADWTTAEKNQIRYRLGLDGATATPTASPTLTVNLNLAQTGLIPRDLGSVADAALTVGDALVAATGVVGKRSFVGTSFVIKTPSTGTTIRTLTADSSTAPTSLT